MNNENLVSAAAATAATATTYAEVVIGEVNGRPVWLAEGKGENPSSLTFDGRTVAQGHAALLGAEVAETYADWYEKNRA